MSTATFQEKVMTSIDVICEARKRKEARSTRNAHVDGLADTRNDQNAPTVSSEARKLHDFFKGKTIGNPHVQPPTLEEIHGFISEATKDYQSPPKDIDAAIDNAKGRGAPLSDILLTALMLEY